MALVTRETGSGLVLAEQAQDEASIARAVKEIDSRYVLQRHPGAVAGGWVYKVFCIVSEDLPAECVLTWSDERGNPLPLSSGLVEEVKKWRPEARGRRGVDADERNRLLREETDRMRRDTLATISEDHRAKIERDQVSVSMGPRARRRDWQRNLRPPQSGDPQ